MPNTDFMKDLGDEEKKALKACEEFYQKEEGKDWHVTGVQETKKTNDGFTMDLMLCMGDQCTMQSFKATAKDGK
eukprot:CAMPEP_0184480616 /NCGR_PEP_ID=MMETSP0113_2-20130426/2110_1 /TAXON_ID=91329 /ORGANISM="Norrisiella sphaerica, Strain BC52" /LENGTH=73 /DNA_ID=CAMNT_0026859191 /DNA_START=49 /DNA_END=270 /DNA_ORIENTATION=-